MLRKRDTDTTLREITVTQKSPNNQCHDESHNHNNKSKPSKSANYKMIDKETRKRVIFWTYLTLCLLAITLCVASFRVEALQKASLKGLRMWQWSLLVAALLSGPLLSYAIVKFILLFIDRDFSIRENIIYYVVGLGESATVVLWFSMILVAWVWVVDEPSYLGMPQQDIGKIKKKYGTTFHIITVSLITLILGSFLWLLKDLVIMKAKSSFHIRRFFDRIKTALFHQFIIERLSRGTIDQFVLTSSSSKDESSFRKIGLGRKEKRLVDLSSFEDVSPENVSCWGMKILIQGIINYPNLCYVISEDGKNSERKDIDCEFEAAHAGHAIFSSVVDETSHLGEQELLNYFTVDKVSDVKRCLLEGAHSKEVDTQVFRKWMVKVYRYRKALVRALEANKGLFRTFNRFVDALLVFLIFALWLIMIRVETRKVIFLIGSALVGSAFIFGDTCRKLLENILFVFLVHPFDIGDCCLIQNTPVIIDEIDFLSTTVLTFDNEKKHYPNSVLSGEPISNFTRSPQMGDYVTISFDIHTPASKIDQLKSYIKSYIEDNGQFWSGEHHWVMELENITTVKLTLRIQHTINYHELTERQIRKTELVSHFKNALELFGLTNKQDEKTDQNQGGNRMQQHEMRRI